MTTTRYLIIDKVNEVYLKIEAEADIRRELGEYFTFEVPGFKFMPQYRNRVWDGKIRLFSYATGKIYAGLYPYIKNWCKENDVHVVDGTKITHTKIEDSKIDNLIKVLKLPHEVRDYQREAFKYSIEKNTNLNIKSDSIVFVGSVFAQSSLGLTYTLIGFEGLVIFGTLAAIFLLFNLVRLSSKLLT